MWDYVLGVTHPQGFISKSCEKDFEVLKGTQGLILWYPASGSFDLIVYADVYYVGYLVDRKSTSEMAHFLGLCLVPWATKKQNFIALSTAEAEYIADASCF